MDEVLEVLKLCPFVSFTTIQDGFPRSRYVLLQHHKEFGLIFLTSKKSQKVKELWENRNAGVLIGDHTMSCGRVLFVRAHAEVLDSERVRSELWNENLAKVGFKGRDDPNLIAVHVSPIQVEKLDGESNEVSRFNV